MIMGRAFKRILLAVCAILYVTGAAAWLALRFPVDRGFGPEPSPVRLPALHSHAVAGFVFLVLFGYLWRAHVEPGLKKQKKKASGWAVLLAALILIATVPFLYYVTGETARAWTIAAHCWLGVVAPAPFLFHLRSRRL